MIKTRYCDVGWGVDMQWNPLSIAHISTSNFCSIFSQAQCTASLYAENPGSSMYCAIRCFKFDVKSSWWVELDEFPPSSFSPTGIGTLYPKGWSEFTFTCDKMTPADCVSATCRELAWFSCTENSPWDFLLNRACDANNPSIWHAASIVEDSISLLSLSLCCCHTSSIWWMRAANSGSKR